MDYTDDFGLRGEEIEKWLQTRDGKPITSFVILDDLDARELHPLEAHLVQTCFCDGLLPEHVEKAISILNGELQ